MKSRGVRKKRAVRKPRILKSKVRKRHFRRMAGVANRSAKRKRTTSTAARRKPAKVGALARRKKRVSRQVKRKSTTRHSPARRRTRVLAKARRKSRVVRRTKRRPVVRVATHHPPLRKRRHTASMHTHRKSKKLAQHQGLPQISVSTYMSMF